MPYIACTSQEFRMTESNPTNNSTAARIDPDLLSILRCPLTRSKLHQDGDFLVAEVGGLRYPIREGIPVMLVEEAKLPAGVESLEAFRRQYGRSEEHTSELQSQFHLVCR